MRAQGEVGGRSPLSHAERANSRDCRCCGGGQKKARQYGDTSVVIEAFIGTNPAEGRSTTCGNRREDASCRCHPPSSTRRKSISASTAASRGGPCFSATCRRMRTGRTRRRSCFMSTAAPSRRPCRSLIVSTAAPGEMNWPTPASTFGVSTSTALAPQTPIRRWRSPPSATPCSVAPKRRAGRSSGPYVSSAAVTACRKSRSSRIPGARSQPAALPEDAPILSSGLFSSDRSRGAGRRQSLRPLPLGVSSH